ncbi:TniQ family protein [Streptomyces sp. NPDC048278]|uniref:TniQ family protein n=1 Tax=Streptomyces sp. NPDC048278 TaxID=3155809 RepID=UPI00343A0766
MHDLVLTPVRVPPLTKELTGSWIRRATARYGLPAQDLLRGILAGRGRVQVTGTPSTGLELFLNTPARAELTRFTGLPLDRLTGLLPSLAATHERLVDDEIARAAWYVPRQAWVAACPPCTGRACQPGRPVLVYPEAAGHVCQRHQRWLLAHAENPASIPLRTLPEVLGAHRRHLVLVRAHPWGADAVVLAAAVVWSWQVQGWQSEAIWQDRVRRVAAVMRCSPTAVMPHALLPYPETIAVARLLVDHRWQQRLREAAAGDGLRSAAGLFLQEAGRRINRPWLTDWLTARTRVSCKDVVAGDPLHQWLQRITAATGITSDGLWTVSQTAARPIEYSDRASFLTQSRPRAVYDEAKEASLTGGWEPVPSPRPGPASSP